jgi:hypothetical protein
MTDALGIHDHATQKLGRRDPSNGPAIIFGEHLTGTPPTTPIVNPAPRLVWPMDMNNEWGDCVVAGVDHGLEAIYTALMGSYANWKTDQILSYYRTQNPNFDPTTGVGDNGMDIQTFLAYLAKRGVILGFAKIDHTNPAEMDAAIYLGLAIITGETLTVAQQTQQVWDVVAGDAVWGGHCTVSVGYPGASTDTCVTWGKTMDMTERFVQTAVEEAWFIVTQAHVNNPSFRAGYDMASFAAQYKVLTGRDFPVSITPVPAPTPTPPPAPPIPTPPPADADYQLAAVAKTWAAARHYGTNHVMALALQKWMAARGL